MKKHKMELLDHIIDTMKEWELKMGRIDSDIRLYYPPDSVCQFLQLPADAQEETVIQSVSQYLQEEAPYLGEVKVIPAKDHRIGVVIPKEGSDYVAEHIPPPVFLQELLQILKQQDLDAIRDHFTRIAKERGGNICEEKEDDGMGTVLFFEQEEIDPYVYCFDSDDFGVTYHRFSRADYERLK